MIRIATVLFIFIVLGIVVLADQGSALLSFVRDIPAGDELGHFVLMGTVSFLVNMSLSASRIKVLSWSVLKGSVFVVIVVTLEEFSQLFFKYRTFSLTDLACDYAGILLFGQLAIRLVARQKTPLRAYEADNHERRRQ
jgi:VanZ family protein